MEFNISLNSSNMSDYDDYYSYDYDYDDSVSNVPLEEIIPVGIVYGTTLLLGVIGKLIFF